MNLEHVTVLPLFFKIENIQHEDNSEYQTILTSLIECGMQMNAMINDWERFREALKKLAASIEIGTQVNNGGLF